MVVAEVFGADMLPALGDQPVPWPDDVPDHLRPEVFEQELLELAELCGASDSLVDVDCTEPPCLMGFMVARSREQGASGAPAPNTCEAWNERYGGAVSRGGDSVLCDDGEVYELTMIGPHVPELAIQPDPEDPWAGIRRLNARKEALKEHVGCTAPASLQVENRLGYRLQWVPDP